MPTEPHQQDEQQLKLLGVFFYVYSGLMALLAVAIVLVAVLMGIGLMAEPPRHDQVSPFWLGWGIGGVLGLCGVLVGAQAVLLALTGQALRTGTRYTLALVGACLSLLHMPIGMVLGVLTLLLLAKPQVKARFS